MHHLSKFDKKHIFLIRDVRGFVTSFINRQPDMEIYKVAKIWKKENKKIERFLKTLPRSNVLRIKYEDLCSDPRNTLSQLYKFLNITQINRINFSSIKQHVLGNKMRLKKTYIIKHDDKWKHQLNVDQLNIIEKTAGKMMQYYNYE